MSALRRDLLERKLWMVVAIMIAGVVAVPVFLLKGASASTTPTVPAPPAARAESSQAATTSQTASGEPAKVVLARIARNPFAGAVPKLSSKPASQKQASSSSATVSSATATTASPSTSTSTVAMVSPSPDTGSASSSATSSSGSATSSTATSSTTPTSTIASTSPTTQAAKPVKVQSWTTYSVSVRFGKDIRVPLKTDIARLTPLPSAQEPEVMFMGVLSTGRSAVFALRQGVGHTGPGLCRPDRALCSAIVIKVGQTEHLTVPTASGGQRKRILRVVKITSSVTHSRKIALDAYERVSHAGTCDLLLADPMLYNLGTGTLSNIPKAMCKGHPNAVPFSYFRTAQ